jgi:hypothetical protein
MTPSGIEPANFLSHLRHCGLQILITAEKFHGVRNTQITRNTFYATSLHFWSWKIEKLTTMSCRDIILTDISHHSSLTLFDDKQRIDDRCSILP